MKKLPVYGAVMLVLLTFAFSSTSAESIPSPALLPRERTVITADNLNEIKQLATWGSGRVYDVAWIDKQHIAFTSEAGTWIYELGQTPVPIRQLTSPDQHVFATSNSHWVVTYSDPEYWQVFSSSLTAWNLAGERRPLFTVSHISGATESPVMHSFGAVGGYVIGSQGAAAYIWRDNFSGDPLRFEQPASNRTEYVIEQAALSTDGKHLATAARANLSDQLIISVWDTDSGQQHILYADEYLPLERLYLWDMQFNEAGDELAAFLETRLWRWDVKTGKALDSIELQCKDDDEANNNTIGTVLSLKYAAGFFLCRFYDPDGTSHLEVRSIQTGLPLASLDQSGFEPTYALSPDAQYIALANATRYTNSGDELARYRITVWDIKHDSLFVEFEGSQAAIMSLEFSPDGKQLLSGSDDGIVRVWDMEAQKQGYSIEPGHSLPVTSLAFSPDGHWLVSAATNPYQGSNYLGTSRGFVARWNLETGQYEKLLDGADSRTTSIVFSLDGKRLYLGDLEGHLRIWDGETFAPLETLSNSEPIQNMQLNSDGSLLAVAGDHQVSIWDTRTKTIINRLQHRMPANYCLIQFSPDDKWLKLCSVLWKVENHGKLIASWQAVNIPEALTDWYRVDERQIRFDPTQGDGKSVYWLSPGYHAPYSPTSIAFSPSHDLIAVGQGSGVIELYGIEKAG